MIKFYETLNDKVWAGRIDSIDNYDAFRWHQWIKLINLNDNELKAFGGKLAVAFIGYKGDKGVEKNKGRIGAAKGSYSIRKELMNLPCCFTKELEIFDCGNINCENASVEESQNALAEAVDKILSLNMFPIVLGGGHEIAFGHFNGIRKNKQDKKIGIVNFDAHFDMRPYPKGSSSGTMFRQIADNEKDNFLYYALGIQKRGNTVELFKTAEDYGAKYYLAKDIINTDIWRILESIDRFIKKSDEIYITICADVFSSGFAPGVSAAQPLGLDPEKVIKMLKYIIKSNKVASFDIAEVSPRFDHDHITARLASTIIFAVVNSLASINDIDL